MTAPEPSPPELPRRAFLAASAGAVAVGRFTTAPAPGSRPRVTLGATSCARYSFRPFHVLSAAAADDRRDPHHPERIWRRLSFADTLELFVLDCRSERLPSTRGTPEATYLSPAQLTWLRDGLTTSTAAFKVIVNSVSITAMPPLYLGASGRWGAYEAQRSALLDHTAVFTP